MSEVAEQENDPQIGNQNEEEEEESAEKKETFQWNTPADEFAEDVASDLEDSEDEGGDAGRRGDGSQSQSIEFSHEVTNGQIDLGEKPKKAKPKHQFPCPKCNKIWNWPWELRRHLVMHFKEVQIYINLYVHIYELLKAHLCKFITFLLFRKNVKMLRLISARSAAAASNGKEI